MPKKKKSWRRKVYTRNNHRCVLCGRQGTRKNPLQVHHIKNKCNGGKSTRENTVTFCRECHRWWHKRFGNQTVYPNGIKSPYYYREREKM